DNTIDNDNKMSLKQYFGEADTSLSLSVRGNRISAANSERSMRRQCCLCSGRERSDSHYGSNKP
ncbi:hypothetical protein BaRGS_00039577, partial [Batillaria attramentaria]